jgi:uncharacterized protein YceK
VDRRFFEGVLSLLAAIGMIALFVLIVLELHGCASISVKSPDGTASASYTGTSIIGSEQVSCGTAAGITTCSESGQNLAALAQAIAPYLGGVAGVPLPAPAATPTAKPVQ